MTQERHTRRRFLRATGSAAAVGCLSSGASRSAVSQLEVSKQWTFSGNSDRSYPTVDNETVYVGSRDGGVYALDAGDGTEQWTFQTGGSVRSSPAIDNGTVYVGNTDDKVYALDTSDGTERWTFQTGDWVLTQPAVRDGIVYFGSRDNNVYALDANDGTQKWAFQTGGLPGPAVGNDGTVFAEGDGGTVYGLDATDGTEQWTSQINGKITASPVVSDDTVLVGSKNGLMYALDTRDGSLSWKFEVGDFIYSEPMVSDGTVFLVSKDDTAHALDANSGQKKWDFRTGENYFVSPVVHGESVYITGGNKLYALDPTEGVQQWAYQISGNTNIEPAVNNDSIFVELDGDVIALSNPTLANLSPTPTTEPISTPISESTSTPTSEPSRSTTSIDSDGRGTVLSLTLLAILGVGGGTLWYTRNGGSKRDENENSHKDGLSESGQGFPLSSTDQHIPEATPNSSEDGRKGASGSTNDLPTTGNLEILSELIEDADRLRAEAGDYRDAGQYDRAIDTYGKAEEKYEGAIETASKRDNIDTERIEQTLAAVQRQRREVHFQQLKLSVDEVRSTLDRVTGVTDESDLIIVQKQLANLESRLTNIEQTATEQNLDDIREEIETLKTRREELLQQVTERLQTRSIPDEIPRAPQLSVDYDELTNKKPIGTGGNADVTKAVFPASEKDVILAIKEPRMLGTIHTDQVDRMLQEAETWNQLDGNDHIVGVVDWGSRPVPWIAMEYMDGGHLGVRIDEMGTKQALWTALAVTKGVRHAHTRGVAHLDLKPENILFRSVEDAWDVPKVADWGLSKHLLKQSKSIEGMSPHYAAPEQFEREYGQADNLTDVYQLGAVFYELLTGQPPFKGRPTQVMRAVMDEQPTPPSEIADVPRALDEILLTALSKQKDDRYDDILYLRDRLQDLLDDW